MGRRDGPQTVIRWAEIEHDAVVIAAGGKASIAGWARPILFAAARRKVGAAVNCPTCEQLEYTTEFDSQGALVHRCPNEHAWVTF